MPRSDSTARLSPIAEPTTTRSPMTAGGDVTWYLPGSTLPTPCVRSIDAAVAEVLRRVAAVAASSGDQAAVDRADEEPAVAGRRRGVADRPRSRRRAT